MPKLINVCGNFAGFLNEQMVQIKMPDGKLQILASYQRTSTNPTNTANQDRTEKSDEDAFKRRLSKEANPSNGHELVEYPVKLKKTMYLKCCECEYEGHSKAELKTHQLTSHGHMGEKKMKMCENCTFISRNVYEMDYHCRSHGHTVRKDYVITCKTCDYLAKNKDDLWNHKKVHIPADKLFECADCLWCGDRLDNLRSHSHSQDHKMKNDYEVVALSKAETKGAKEVAHYYKKLAKDIKRAKKHKA